MHALQTVSSDNTGDRTAIRHAVVLVPASAAAWQDSAVGCCPQAS